MHDVHHSTKPQLPAHLFPNSQKGGNCPSRCRCFPDRHHLHTRALHSHSNPINQFTYKAFNEIPYPTLYLGGCGYHTRHIISHRQLGNSNISSQVHKGEVVPHLVFIISPFCIIPIPKFSNPIITPI